MSLPRRSTTVAVVSVALLVAASIGAVGLVTALSTADAEPPEVIRTNSTSYVTPDPANISRQEYSEVSLDVGTAMVADAERLQARHDELVMEDSDDQQTVDIVEHRVRSLEQRQEQLLQNFSSNTISTETLLTELARLEVAADQYRAAVVDLENEDLPDPLATRVSVLSVEPTMLDNPVTGEVVDAKTAGAGPMRVYVAGADDGIVAATVIEDRYIRQATLRGERDPFGGNQFDEADGQPARVASERGSQIYGPTGGTRGFLGTQVYEFNVNHSTGELFAYLDGATTNPFHEYQYKQPVVSIPAQTSSSTGDSFRLNVQHTNATGPMAIFGTGTGGLSAVNISINGQYIDTIEGGEQIWTVQPVGEFTVTATPEDGEPVTVRVRP